jgi:hypothetical protein
LKTRKCYNPCNRALARPELTREFLEKKYIQERATVIAISKETGWSSTFIHKRITRLGINRPEKYKDLTGHKYGRLTVLNFESLGKYGAVWNCVCECGSQKKARAHNLKNGNTKSCGCLARAYVGKISGRHFSNIRLGAKHRNIHFDITIEEIWDLYVEQNGKCAISGEDIVLSLDRDTEVTASLDRIDSNAGYTIENVQWVHKEINCMKMDHPEKHFLEWIEKIYLFQKTKSPVVGLVIQQQ